MKMIKTQRFGLCIVLVALLATASFAEKQFAYMDASLSVDQRVDDLLRRMTLEEKVSQMRIFGAPVGIRFGENDQMVLTKAAKSHLKDGVAGIKNPYDTLPADRSANLNNQLQKYIIETNRLGIPALFVGEAYNGVDAVGCTRFGRPLNMAATWDVQLTHDIWSVIGREARLRGYHMVHSPEGDIVRDPRFGRMTEAMGEDTYLTTEMLVAAVTGVQGNYDGTGVNSTHIGAVTKHFVGYGQVMGGRNFAAIEVSPRVLQDELMPPFEAAVKRGHTLGIMPSHGDLNGVACHANPKLLTDLLRNQWGFKGYTVSDAFDVGRLNFLMKVAESKEEAVKLGLKAGVDIDLYSSDIYSMLPDLVEKDPTLMPYINRSVGHVLRTKFILGLFENPYVEVEDTKKEVRSVAALAMAKRMDEESMILLKNENQLLPLRKDEKRKIALLGPLVDNEKTLKAFEAVAGDKVSFTVEKGYELTDRDRKRPTLTSRDGAAIDKMVAKAKEADVIVLFLGGDEFTAKESTFFNWVIGDRATLEPVGAQDELMQRVAAFGKPVIVVLKHRRTLAINVINKEAEAILDCWDLGEFGDEMVAKALFGEFSPSGKLPVTVPRTIGQIPFHYSMKEISFMKDYLFLEHGPLYPFGYGLSYTTFTYAEPKLSSTEMGKEGELVVRIDVTNSGNISAKEVVQLYVKDLFGSVLRPGKELKGFQKVELKPGETRTVEFTITPDMLVFTGVEMTPVLEEGDYEVMVGTSSADYKTAEFRLK